MNKILIYILTLFILSNCSFNKNSKIWKKEELQLENKENVKIILADKEVNITELNPYIKINLSNINFITSPYRSTMISLGTPDLSAVESTALSP